MARLDCRMVTPPAPFSNAAALTDYAERTARLVPGLRDLLAMTALLLAEQAPSQAAVLVVGAGGGAELKTLAERQPGWRFTGVDPSAPMLDLARATLGPFMDRIDLHHGTTDTAPTGPFDAATCLLTLHFLAPDERRATLREMHRRLKPGAALVVAHLSLPGGEERALWLSRYAAFATASGVDAGNARHAASTIGATLPVLSPEEDEALLAEAGFRDVRLFYAGLAFRGWVARA